MSVIVEHVYAVRAHTVDGACVDLLLFADRLEALNYLDKIAPLPLGFNRVEIVPRRIIGDVVERRVQFRTPPTV